MSTRAIRPFLPALRKVERELRAPVPAKVRILQELEYDLEELRRELEAEGLPPAEARQAALEALVPEGRALRELARLYTPSYRRVTGRLSATRVRLLERSALVVLTLIVLVVETLVLLRADLFRDPSPFMWVVLGLGAVTLTAIAAEAFATWVKGDHERVRPGPGAILVAAGVTLVVGVMGALADTYRFIQVLETGGGPTQRLVFELMVRECALVAVALVLALAGGLGWFVLTQWLTAVSAARREVLGLDLIQTRQ